MRREEEKGLEPWVRWRRDDSRARQEETRSCSMVDMLMRMSQVWVEVMERVKRVKRVELRAGQEEAKSGQEGWFCDSGQETRGRETYRATAKRRERKQSDVSKECEREEGTSKRRRGRTY